MPNTNSDIQRKAGFFHSLGKVITEDANSAGNEKYKSAHNVRSNEVWMDSISYAPTSASASQYADGIIVKQVGSASGVVDVQNNFLFKVNAFKSSVKLTILTFLTYAFSA
jgi:hypothetical protein